MSSWTDLEKYEELERRYQQAIDDYRRREAAYEAILVRDPSDPTLKPSHDALERAKQEVEELWSQLLDLRRNAASTRQIRSKGGL